MKYQFKTGIDSKEYDKFVRNFPSTSFMQTPAWSLVKTAWDNDYVGLYSDKKLVCGAMILKRNLFLKKKLKKKTYKFIKKKINKFIINFFVII